MLAQRKVAEKESALVRSSLEIFTLKRKMNYKWKVAVQRNIRQRDIFLNLSVYCAGQFFFERKEKLPKKKPFDSCTAKRFSL